RRRGRVRAADGSDVDDDVVYPGPAAGDEAIHDTGPAGKAPQLLRVVRLAVIDEEAEQAGRGQRDRGDVRERAITPRRGERLREPQQTNRHHRDVEGAGGEARALRRSEGVDHV